MTGSTGRVAAIPAGQGRKGKGMIILGLASIAVLFVVYSRYQDSELLTPDAIDVIQRLAYGFYIALLASFGAISYGLYIYHKDKARNAKRGIASVIALATWNPKSRKIFVITFVGYGLFFSLASGTLVYQPEVNFAIHYGADIPSGFVAPCCGELGYMPKIIIYLTEHIGLQIVPINLVLQVTVSYLVALNVSLAASAYGISKKDKGIGTVGAITGLFIACPTCAGTFSSLIIGTASAIALTATLVQLQTAFIGISIPVLFAATLIMAKKLQNPDGSCKIDPTT